LGGDLEGLPLPSLLAILPRESEQVAKWERLGEEGDRPEWRGQVSAVGDGREDDNRDGRPRWVRKLMPAELNAVHHRHHQVKQYQARQEPATQMVKGFLAVTRLLYGVAFNVKEIGEDIANVIVIFDQEDATGWMVCCHGRSALLEIEQRAASLQAVVSPTARVFLPPAPCARVVSCASEPRDHHTPARHLVADQAAVAVIRRLAPTGQSDRLPGP
jgi:hypothetical protein